MGQPAYAGEATPAAVVERKPLMLQFEDVLKSRYILAETVTRLRETLVPVSEPVVMLEPRNVDASEEEHGLSPIETQLQDLHMGIVETNAALIGILNRLCL